MLSLTWDAVDGATEYDVYRGTIPGSLSSIATDVAGTTYLDRGPLTSGAFFYYTVRASNSVGDGPQSAEVRERALAVPGGTRKLHGTCRGIWGCYSSSTVMGFPSGWCYRILRIPWCRLHWGSCFK